MEAVGVHEDALAAVLGAAHHHQIALMEVAELLHGEVAVLPHGHAVHAALLDDVPLAVHLDVLGEDAHGVVVLRGHAVPGGGQHPGVGGVGQLGLGEVRGLIGE